MLARNSASVCRDNVSAFIDIISVAIVFLDDSGRILRYNRYAAETIRRSRAFTSGADGHYGHRLLPRDRPTAMRLAQLIGQLAHDPEMSAVLLPIPGSAGSTALLARLSALEDGPAGPSILVRLADPFERIELPPPTVLRQLWGLTTAEAQVAIAVVDHEGLTAAARALGITANTAKAHLAHVFEKTGVHSQTKLACQLMSVAAASQAL